MMKKIFTLGLGLISLSCLSQTTYNINDYGAVGYGFWQSKATSSLNAFDFTLTGTNYSWNYAGLGTDSYGLYQVIDPDNTPYKAPFIAECIINTGNPVQCNTDWNNLTDIARVEFDSIATGFLTIYDITSLMTYSGGYLVANIQGARIKDTGGTKTPLASEFSNKDTVFVFPLNYNNMHTSHAKWSIDLNSLGYNLTLSIDYDRQYIVEGWGSLLTPYKLHNDVLKVRTFIDEKDTIRYNGTPYPVARQIVQYTWFDPNYGLPVMQASGQITGGTETIQEVTYLDSTYVGINENNLSKLTIFPNPATTEVTVTLQDNISYTHAIITDATGKIILRSTNLTNINVEGLHKGTYFIGVYNNKQPIGFRKFSKN